MNGAQFQRNVSVAFSRNVLWSDIVAKTAAFARQDRDAKIRAGQFSARYDTFVNGQKDAREESLRPGGVILYRALLLGPAIAVAIAELQKRSPRRSGDYAKSFVVGVSRGNFGGRPIPAARFDPERVTPDATEAWVFNTEPYSRLLDVQMAGNRRIRVMVPPGFFSDAAAAVRRRFPQIQAMRMRTVSWPGAERTKSGRRIEYPAVWISLAR